MSAAVTQRLPHLLSPSLSIKGGAGFPDGYNTLSHNELDQIRQFGRWGFRRQRLIEYNSLSDNQLKNFGIGIRRTLRHPQCRIQTCPRMAS